MSTISHVQFASTMIRIAHIPCSTLLLMLVCAGDVQATSGVQDLSGWQRVMAFGLAGVVMALAAWTVSTLRGSRLRRAVADGRLTQGHVEVLILIVERCASQSATRPKNVRDRLDLDKNASKVLLKELVRYGCAKPGDLGGFVPTDVGVEFLRSVDLHEFTSEAVEILESQERIRRLCTLAAASGGGSSGDGSGG